MIGTSISLYLLFGFWFWLCFYAGSKYSGSKALGAAVTWPAVAIVLIFRCVKDFWKEFL